MKNAPTRHQTRFCDALARKKAIEDRVIRKCMFKEWERKDFRSAEKITTAGRNKEKTSFWPVDDFSARGPAKLS